MLRILRDLASRLNARVYLFGSYARGDHMLDSDVDVVVVSPLFEGMPYPNRVAFVRSLLPPDLGFDIIALTPREFRERLDTPFFKELSRYWIEVVPG